MNAKTNNSLNSPLKKTAFPINIALFQNSSNQSQTTLSAQASKQQRSILNCQKYRDEAVPNFFQYNDRLPLILSSDEEDNQQLHSNHYQINPFDKKNVPYSSEYSKEDLQLTNEKLYKQIKAKDHIYIKDFNENEEKQSNKQANTQINIKIPNEQKNNQHKEIDNQPSNTIPPLSSKMQKKKLSVTVAKQKQSKKGSKKDKQATNEENANVQSIEIKHEQENSQLQKSLPIEELINYQKKTLQNTSKAQYHQINNESGVKEKKISLEEVSSISSNTGHILDKIKHQDDSVSLGQHQQSDKHQKQLQSNISPVKIIDNQLNTSIVPQKRRRNRIFQGSSARNKSKLYITPDKGVQTQLDTLVREKNTEFSQYDLYPQIKALNILGKIVDQISPKSIKKQNKTILIEQSRQIWSNLIDSLEILEENMLTLRNINEIDEVQLPQTIILRADIKKMLKDQKIKLQPLKLNLDGELQFSQIRLLSKFQQIQKQFQMIDFTLKNMIDSKYSLAGLARRTKDLMVLINKGEYKKTYSLLEDFSIEIQKMKSQKASCGNHRLQKIFKQFLQGQIRQLEEVQIDFRNNLKSQVNYFKL